MEREEEEKAKTLRGNEGNEGAVGDSFLTFVWEGGPRGRGQHSTPKFIIIFYVTLAS